jgi:multimeric flavodoxin WrbA
MIPESIARFIDAQAREAPGDHSDLRAVFINGTLKRSPQISNTEGLIDVSARILRIRGVRVDIIRTVDHVIPPGVYPDMREQGWERDDFPGLYRDLIAPAHILVLASPIWLGDQSSPTRLAIERLYAYSGEVNAAGQWTYYGKAGGVVITGNEDGGKHCAAQMLYALQHIGCTIPAQADTYWNGEAGPGPSFLDEGSGGPQNAWTLRNTVFMTWNLLHLARMLADSGGVPAVGNRIADWDLSNPANPNPEYR